MYDTTDWTRFPAKHGYVSVPSPWIRTLRTRLDMMYMVCLADGRVSTFIAGCDVTERNGGTHVIPGMSHPTSVTIRLQGSDKLYGDKGYAVLIIRIPSMAPRPTPKARRRGRCRDEKGLLGYLARRHLPRCGSQHVSAGG
jgi:hypothetical protein